MLIEGKKYAPEHLGRILVLGLGKSGHAVLDYLLPLLGTRISALAVAAGGDTPAARADAERAKAAGAVVAFGNDAVAPLSCAVGGSFDLCIASPGIPEISDFFQSAKAASGELVSEVEFAWRESDVASTWVAITGTNGKTTTTLLVAHLLKDAGLAARAVGNIGDACIASVAADDTSVYVAEVSSFQLESTSRFAPNVAVLLNITPDHVEWHGTLEAYAAAKWKAIANLAQVPGSVAVLCATDDAVRARIRELRRMTRSERGYDYVPVGTKDGITGDMRERCGAENAAFVAADGVLTVALRGETHRLCAESDLLIKGSHNTENALVAASCALALGVASERVAASLRSFAPLEHRIEPCGSIAGVSCYNDSKATNVDATLKAFSAFDAVRPIVLLGGHDKGTDLAPLVKAAREHAKAVVIFGEARERFLSAFGGESAGEGGELAVIAANHMEDALDAGLATAVPGDVLLLSPACSSFDEFTCYEQRGDVFKQLVAVRSARA